MGPVNITGPSVLIDKEFPLLKNSGPSKSPVSAPGLNVGSVEAQKGYGSGYFDVSTNYFGSHSGPTCNTTNSFGMLQDEVDCFDTELGLWEREIDVVKNYVENKTRPKIEEYSSWSENMRKYYDGLTKVNGDEAEVDSETDEMARFMKIGSNFSVHLFLVFLMYVSFFVLCFYGE
ncbi:hypothetical protein HanOQP8_Chr17g0675281 [Helianthus annuus]|nr:hypothetical protein HanOQP8_Chr17g0675281 [Helianthus annuus]